MCSGEEGACILQVGGWGLLPGGGSLRLLEEGETQQGTQPLQRLRGERGRTSQSLEQQLPKAEGGSEPESLQTHGLWKPFWAASGASPEDGGIGGCSRPAWNWDFLPEVFLSLREMEDTL